MKFTRNEKIIIISISILIIAMTFLTRYYGSVDIGDYSDTAKYFAGMLNANLRVSHSILYGFILSPFIKVFGNFMIFKIASLFFLFLLVLSVYLATNRSKNALFLMLLSPIVWYMAPWINPIQISSLLFFWAYCFIKKYEETNKNKFLFFSGVFAGLSWAFWDAMLFFTAFLAISFLFNKKFYNFILFSFFVLIGLAPKLIIDQFFLGFAFVGIMRYFFGVVSASFFGGIYGTMSASSIIPRIITLLLFLPLFSYKILSREEWNWNRKAVIFIVLSVLLLIKQTQVRYLLLIYPIILLEIHRKMSSSDLKKQIIFSLCVILIVLVPYAIQMRYSTNNQEASSFIFNAGDLKISENQDDLILEDLKSISADFPNSVFVVGNKPDDYAILAHIYWGSKISEFASIQDYSLYFQNKTSLFEKKFMPSPKIQERRQIWIAGGISKNENDNTDYNSIRLGIGLGEPINLPDFKLIRKYNFLYLSEK